MWNKNKNEENKENKENDVNFSDVLVLFLFYFISIISLIFLLFVPYDETNDKEFSLKEISNQSMNFKKIIPYFLILISLSISIGTYNLHSIQYITYYYEAYKGLLMPLFIGIACIIKYIITRIICNIFGENKKEYQSKDNYKLFTLLIIIIILICFIISLIFTYLIEKEIKLIMQQKKIETKTKEELSNELKKELKKLTVKPEPKKKFKEDFYILFRNGKYENFKEIKIFLILNLLSKLEKIEWKNNINLNLYTLHFNYKRYLILVFIIISTFFGIIHDKYEFKGFKFFINLGNIINIISCIIYILFYDAINKSMFKKILISFINLFFVGNYYIIMLPELIRKYGTKYILEISGYIALANIISNIIEIFFIINNLNKTFEIILLFFQIIVSIYNIILIRTEKINETQYDLDIQPPNEIINKSIDIDSKMQLNELGLNNINYNEE